MREFEFHRPSTVAEALGLLRGASEGKFLAGGQSLLPVLKLDMAQPSDLISLAGLTDPGLRTIQVDGDGVTIGALCTHAEVAASPEVRRAIPGLAQLCEGIGDPQVRNRGTLGGSLAHADPAADYPAAVLALQATVRTDRRTIRGDELFTGLFSTALEPDELITAARFKIPARAAYVKFASHASKYALVGVMVAQHKDKSVRVAVTGAGPSAFRVAAMEQALAQRFEPAALAGITVAAEELSDSAEASAAYRAHLIAVMARRAVQAALG
ncbi:MAG: xanthine dehydrogenase family protein subunit M [Polyangia bacterium]